MARLSVVVPVYSSEPYLVEMFDKLFLDALRRRPPRDAELVIVDDASPLADETRRLAEEAGRRFPVVYHRNATNLGMVRSLNEGLRRARGEVLVVANSDARFAPGSIESLVRTLRETPGVGLVGPMSNGAYGAPLQTVRGFAPLRDFGAEELERVDRFADALERADRSPVEARWLVGFCMAFARGLWERVGPFDERFGTGYFEEADYALRARAAGYRHFVDRRAFVFHGGLKAPAFAVQGSSSQTMRTRPLRALGALARNAAYLVWKHGPRAFEGGRQAV